MLHAGVMIRQLKSGRFAGKDVEVVLRSGGRFFDPVAELQRLMTVDRVPLNEEGQGRAKFVESDGRHRHSRGVHVCPARPRDRRARCAHRVCVTGGEASVRPSWTWWVRCDTDGSGARDPHA